MKVSFCVFVVLCAQSGWQEAQAVDCWSSESRPTRELEVQAELASRLRFFGADRGPPGLGLSITNAINGPGPDQDMTSLLSKTVFITLKWIRSP